MAHQFDFGPTTVRIGYSVLGYMFYVNVCPTECLDVARSLFALGASYISAYTRVTDPHGIYPSYHTWTFIDPTGCVRDRMTPFGYSNPY